MTIILLIIILTYVCWKKKKFSPLLNATCLRIRVDKNVAYNKNEYHFPFDENVAYVKTKISTMENEAYGKSMMTQISTQENDAYGKAMTQISTEENVAYGKTKISTMRNEAYGKTMTQISTQENEAYGLCESHIPGEERNDIYYSVVM